MPLDHRVDVVPEDGAREEDVTRLLDRAREPARDALDLLSVETDNRILQRSAGAGALLAVKRTTRASERVSSVLLAAPVRYSSNDRTKSDQLPRESFDNQNPYVVNVEW
jgi:hypothetical protein